MDDDVLPAPPVFFRPAEAPDLPTIIDLETASYPADEAATPERLKFRLENAGDYFLVAVAPPADATPSGDGALQVVGFVCSTLTSSDSLTHDSMATHEPQGSLLCVHSVCIAEGQRRRGLGSKLMRAYVNFVSQTSAHVTEIRLLCKEHLPPHALAEEEDSEIFVDIPDPEHIVIADAWPSAEDTLAEELRAHFDARFSNPLKTTSDRWDYWHVPGQYTLMRTPADAFFPPDLYDRLEDALTEYGERVLGCRGISPVWLSYYVDGCRQELHTDAPHGPWAFVLSLTRWEDRAFSGGETVLLNPQVLDFWRVFDPALGQETPQLTTLIEPCFSRLAAFDPRLPHGVRCVEGPRDPRAGRIVLHGWFTSPTPFFSGALSEADATPALNAALGPLYEALSELTPAVGAATVRVDVGPEGRTRGVEFLTNTVMMRPSGCVDTDEARMEVLGTICDHLFAVEWPPAGGPTAVTLPFIFE